MYKIVFILITVILVLTTLCAGFFNPPMHKAFFVYNSDYTITESAQDVEIVTRMPEQQNPVEVKQTTKTVQNKAPTAVKSVQTPAVTTTAQQEAATAPETTVEQTVSNPLLNMLSSSETTTPSKTVTVTEEEKARQELIQWNIWRSNLQNRIMEDVHLPYIQEGTIFRFTFDVDKYGKISNVQTWASTSAYTPYAIQYIAPVIRSYQGRDILNFPAGSNRISTTVEGGWRISKVSKFSTPEDFKDTEKIIKE